jgi:septum formation protein
LKDANDSEIKVSHGQGGDLLQDRSQSHSCSGRGQDLRLILASTSPRRHELIKLLRLPFEIVPSQFEEVIDTRLNPDALVLFLAAGKGREVYERIAPDSSPGTLVVLGADTIVFLDGTVLGKPRDEEHAFEMLKRLSGRRHEVYTGVSLIVGSGAASQPRTLEAFERSQVFFRSMSDEEIQDYVKSGEPMDKAGAYALQGTGSAFVARIDGCFTNVIGLPIPVVVALLRQAGVNVLGSAHP